MDGCRAELGEPKAWAKVRKKRSWKASLELKSTPCGPYFARMRFRPAAV